MSGRSEAVGVRHWYAVGVGCVVVAIIAFFLMQTLKGDYLPPEISVSQYGVGPSGWVFSVFTVLIAAGPLAFGYSRRTGRLTRALLWIGTVGAVIMAVVRTDPSGLQQSLNSRIHTAASVLVLGFLPFGICGALAAAAPVWRRLAWGLTAFSAICLILLVVAAFGVDTAGLGPQRSWALWQAGAAVADVLLVIVLAIGIRTVAAAPIPAASNPSGVGSS